jgi:hypothetical protein
MLEITMDIREYTAKYGKTSAKWAFRTSDHCVITVYPKKYVMGICGQSTASEPLGNGEDEQTAIDKVIAVYAPLGVSYEVLREE